MSHDNVFVFKGNKPLGAAFSHARKVAAKTGGGKKKEREVVNRYLKRNGEKPIGKSCASTLLTDHLNETYEGTMSKSIKTASELLVEHLAKAVGRKGEGSRGGKIIGHTRTGKPVYARAGASDAKYVKFTNDDHRDAMQVHEDLRSHLESRADTARADGNHREAKMTDRSASRHEDIAGDHSRTARIGVAGTGPSPDSGGKMLRTADGKKMFVPGKDGAGRSSDKAKLGVGMGLTSSGKTVGAVDSPDSATHKEFTAQDHKDAGDLHQAAANKYEDENHHDFAGHHMNLARKHYARAETKKPAAAPDLHKKGHAYHAAAAAIHDRIADGHAQLHENALDHGDDGEMMHRVHADNHRMLARKHRMKAEKATKSESANDFSAADVLGAYLAKGGEGTRGGKIIGHTKSGKPIYENRHADGYKGFSHRDHLDAMHTHDQARLKAEKKAIGFHTHAQKMIADFHDQASRSHEHAASKEDYMGKSDGDGDGAHGFSDINNADLDRILVRPVMDVENSPLNDAIAAAWPGMPFMATASSNFCAMDTRGKQGI